MNLILVPIPIQPIKQQQPMRITRIKYSANCLMKMNQCLYNYWVKAIIARRALTYSWARSHILSNFVLQKTTGHSRHISEVRICTFNRVWVRYSTEFWQYHCRIEHNIGVAVLNIQKALRNKTVDKQELNIQARKLSDALQEAERNMIQ